MAPAHPRVRSPAAAPSGGFDPRAAAALLAGLAGAGATGLLLHAARRRAAEEKRNGDLKAAGRRTVKAPPALETKPDSSSGNAHSTRRAGAMLHASAGLLAIAVLADSGLEHYRGGFRNPAMFLPLASAGLALLTNAQRPTVDRPAAARKGAHLLAGAIGAAGLGFHLYNIGKRPGGYGWLNFFYAAPVGAPAALSLAGLIGYAGERLDGADAPDRLLGLPFGPAMAGLVGFGLAGTVAEVALLHFRGAYHNPFMWLPVALPPVSAAALARAALVKAEGPHQLGRGLLWATFLLGIGGVGFHAYGVSRNMGGWSNWSQNLLAGPPLPAPPSFSALALAGLACLDLIEADRGRLPTCGRAAS